MSKSDKLTLNSNLHKRKPPIQNRDTGLEQQLCALRKCQLCLASLPLKPKPIFQLNENAKILIAGQAPGLAAHERNIPFDDKSGERLRQWLGVNRMQFYDPELFAIMPMAFCYPGKSKSGDVPPPKLCSQTWRSPLLQSLTNLEFTLVIGQYAQAYHLPSRKTSLTETVRAWREYWPTCIPLPHPSPRNNIWLKRNPWFELELLPELKVAVQRCLSKTKG